MKMKFFMGLFLVLLLAPSASIRAADGATTEVLSTPLIQVHGLPPEALRIPASISISESTPFYNHPDDSLKGKSEGLLAPQEGIRVLLADPGWARGHCWWKIETYLGPKWIHPEPWTVDTPPPEKITLFTDTPIYADKDDSVEPTAVLSPQDIQVTGAEKQWFYSNNVEELKWVRIQTSWLGEQWVHLPVRKIGYMLPVDSYSFLDMHYLLNDPTYNGPTASRAGHMFKYWGRETVHVTGEYANVYQDTGYRIETPFGTKYIKEQGTPVVREERMLELKTATPIFPIPHSPSGSAPVLPPQTVTSFERTVEGSMYHIRTSWGDVWVNPEISEPADTVPLDGSLRLSGRHTLYQFPFANFHTEFALDGKDIRPNASWTDPSGAVWYRLDSTDGTKWVKQEPDIYS